MCCGHHFGLKSSDSASLARISRIVLLALGSPPAARGTLTPLGFCVGPPTFSSADTASLVLVVAFRLLEAGAPRANVSAAATKFSDVRRLFAYLLAISALVDTSPVKRARAAAAYNLPRMFAYTSRLASSSVSATILATNLFLKLSIRFCILTRSRGGLTPDRTMRP